MTTWNDRLREAREAAGIPKAQFAREVKVSAPTVTDWESGKIRKIDGENLIKACEILRVSPKWLLTGRPPRSWVDQDQAPADYIDGEVVRPHLPSPSTGAQAPQTIADLLDALAARLAKADPSVRDAVSRLILSYLDSPQSGAKIAGAITQLLETDDDSAP